MTPEQEIWAVALWVEKHHGKDGGAAYIAGQIDRLTLEGHEAGAAMWKKVAARLMQLQPDVPPPDRT